MNTYTASYTSAADGTLTLGPIASTKMAGDEAAMDAEAKYLEALATVTGYSVSGGLLDMFAGSRPGAHLRLRELTGATAPVVGSLGCATMGDATTSIHYGLDERVCLVTGATQGIGAACARLLADQGAQVVLAGVDDGQGRALAGARRRLRALRRRRQCVRARHASKRRSPSTGGSTSW